MRLSDACGPSSLEPARIRRIARPEDASLSRTEAQEAKMADRPRILDSNHLFLTGEDCFSLPEKVLEYTQLGDAFAELTRVRDVRFIWDVIDHCPSAEVTEETDEDTWAVGCAGPWYDLEVHDTARFLDEIQARIEELRIEAIGEALPSGALEEHGRTPEKEDAAATEEEPSPFEEFRRALKEGDWERVLLTEEDAPELFGKTFVGGIQIGSDPRRRNRNR